MGGSIRRKLRGLDTNRKLVSVSSLYLVTSKFAGKRACAESCFANKNWPTSRLCHVEIQHVAIQEWQAKQEIIVAHILSILNPSDDLTKALGWILHMRHAWRGMGHYQMRSQETSSVPRVPPHTSTGTLEAGEGVGAQTLACPGLNWIMDSDSLYPGS